MKRLLLAAVAALALAARTAAPAHTQLVIVVDGLRPDYVTPEVMPRLYRLGQRGIVFNAHHSSFPTVTRVNASSFVTGSYPETHGLMGNTIYIPSTDATRGLDTGERENLLKVEAHEKLLTAPTLGEILHQRGRTLMAVSSGSSGSAYLLNQEFADGPIVHNDFVKPASLAGDVAALLGPAPEQTAPDDGQNRRAVDAYVKVGLEHVRPDVTFMWLTDPDHTAHGAGIGAPLTRKSLELVDACIGRIQDDLAARGLLDRVNILVTSDHGFSTHTGEFRLEALLAPFAGKMADGSPDLVVAEGAIYLRGNHDANRVKAIVARLQERPEVGAIFTRARVPGSTEGAAPGTLSFDVVRWNHVRSGDILVSANWSDQANAAGFKGMTTQRGVAGHGTSSPYDVHNTLIAAGPDFREHATSDVPTANVDIAPTLLRLLGLPAQSTMTGRVIEEGLRGGASAGEVAHTTVSASTPDAHYVVTAHLSTVNGYRYFDFTEVKRR